jgi:16S rRNA (cytidine1402-2'-O)-methyltransferase
LTEEQRGGGATPGALHIVSTPIGNLADLTPRAVAVLREVGLIVAEDTRVSRPLLASIGVQTEVTALPGFDEAERVAPIISRLQAGTAVALISDAGTPLISDPGGTLVAAAVAAGARVIPIPGASALLAAVVAAGVTGPRWSFEGFLPRGGADRAKVLGAIAADERGTVIYEAGPRVAATLAELARVCGGERTGAVCRELTKLHEEVRRGTLDTLATAIAAGEMDARGEFVIVVGAQERADLLAIDDPEGPYAAALELVGRAVTAGEPRSAAIRRIATLWGLERRRLWNLAHDDAAPESVDDER